MKLIKNVIFKRIAIYLCCTVLFSSSIFMAYSVPVCAETTYGDLLEDALYIAGAAAGIYFSGGTLTPALLIPFIERLAGTGFDVYDYVTQDPETGTTTISADFVNLVLQAYKQYQQENGDKFDGTLDYDDTTKIYKYGSSDYHLKTPTVTYSSVMSGCESYYPIAVLLVAGTTQYNYNNWGYGYNPNDTTKGYGCFVFYYVGTPDTSNYGIIPLDRNPNTLYKKPSCIMYADGVEEGRGEGFLGRKISGPGENAPGYFISFNSSTIPVYTSFDMMKDAFHSGDYSHAENYSVGTSSGETSSYTGEYNGGDITVLTSSLDALRDKIAELEASNKSLEEKLKELLEWLKLTGGGSGGGDVTVDIDLSTTNTLLSKILAKVTQIFDKMSETAGNTMDSVVDSIKNLERMLNRYLSAITGDLDDIKGKLDQMTEEEFGEKTDSFLSETMDSFSEIGGVAKTKFPFSLPNDMRLLIERITVKPAENASLHSDTISQVTPYSGEHGGGGSTDGKPNPPGGGGASRPPGGIAYVEQGTAGECFTLSPTGAPLIRCPIVIKSRNIDFSIVIDLSEFDKVATLSRTFLTLLFVYGLLNLTFKVMGLWGDLVE